MNYLRQEILDILFPDYERVENTLETYTDYELELIVNDFPDDISDIEDLILKKVQWDIIDTLLKPFINNWDVFYSENEDNIEDYCFDSEFISYDPDIKTYLIHKETIIEVCEDLIGDKEYSINEDVNFQDVIAELNKTFPIKFCEE